jgi:hypothetical protein
VTRPRRRPSSVGAAAALSVGVVLTAACGSGPSTTAETLPPGTTARSSTTTTTPAAGEAPGTSVPGSVPGSLPEGTGTAVIDELELRNTLSCQGEVDVEVTATYRTTGAASVAFLVDGRQVEGDPPVSGRFAVPMRCNDRSHTVVLVAVDPDGRTTLESRVVLTTTTPQGN